MLTIHHLRLSQSERIVWLAEELGLDYECKLYTRRTDNRLAPDEYKALHPMGIAPVITDGDLRRMLEKGNDIIHTTARDIMGIHPKTIEGDALAVDALDRMRKNNITQLVVIEDKRYAGVIHLHDLIREGII